MVDYINMQMQCPTLFIALVEVVVATAEMDATPLGVLSLRNIFAALLHYVCVKISSNNFRAVELFLPRWYKLFRRFLARQCDDQLCVNYVCEENGENDVIDADAGDCWHFRRVVRVI